MQQQPIARTRRPAARAAWAGFLTLTALAGVAWDAGPARSEPARADQEAWYLYRLGGHDVGHIHETVRRRGEDVTTTVETGIVINRLGTRVEIKGTAVFTEAADGQLRGAHAEMSTSRQTTTLDARVGKDAVRLLVSTGGKEYRRDLPFSEAPLGPWGLRQRTPRGLRQVGDTLTCQTFVPELQRLATVTRKLLETNAPLPGPGAKAAYARVEERLEGDPAARTLWLDGEGRVVRQTEPGPFGETETVLTDRATALRAGGGHLPEEMYGQTLVRANVRLPGPRGLSRVVVRLRQKDPDLGWPEFAGPGQTVRRRDGRDLVLEVRQVKAEEITPGPAKADGVAREYLEPNAVVQSDDAEVRRVAHEVVGDEADAFRAACRLRDWVHRRLTFDLGMMITPASEVIRQRRGTCLAYAVALAALSRAAGIPSRVVMGYAYVSGIWGGHAWVEVRAGGRWVPLDAALPSPGPADAARIACVRTSLAEGPGPLLAALGRVFGNVQVTVVEYEAGGKCVPVPEGARAFTIDGDTYRNPWLGLEVRKPAGYRFAETDAVYPDTTVVALQGPGGEHVRVRQADPGPGTQILRKLGFSGEPAREEVAGRSALVVESATAAGLTFVAGPDRWVLTAEGEHAGDLLRRAAGLVTTRPAGR